MASNRKVMVLPGDGIGNEVMAANMKLIDWLAKYRSLAFEISEGLVGGAAYDCLLYTSPSPRDQRGSRMPSSA